MNKAVEFKDKDQVSSILQNTVRLLELTVPEKCCYVLVAMPVPVEKGQTPAFLIATNSPDNDTTSMLLDVLHNRMNLFMANEKGRH